MSDCVPVGEEERFIEEADSLISTFSTLGKASDHVATSKSSEQQRKTAKNHFNNFFNSPEVRADDMLSKLPVNLDEIPVEDMADHHNIRSPSTLFQSRVAVFPIVLSSKKIKMVSFCSGDAESYVAHTISNFHQHVKTYFIWTHSKPLFVCSGVFSISFLRMDVYKAYRSHTFSSVEILKG